MASERGAARRWLVVAVSVATITLVASGWLVLRGQAGDVSAAAPVHPRATGKGPVSAPPSASADPQPSSTPKPSPSGDASPSRRPPSALTTVPVRPAKTKAPVAMDEKAGFGTGVAVRLVRIESVRGVAHGPGEIAGPALRLTLRMLNDGARRVPLTGLVVNVSYGPQRTPASTLSGPGFKPFGTSIAPGGTATGAYVFAVPPAQRGKIFVAVSYAARQPTVVFRGSAP